MIRFAAEKREQDPLALWLVSVASMWLDSNEHGVDLCKLMRVIYLERPSPLRLVIDE